MVGFGIPLPPAGASASPLSETTINRFLYTSSDISHSRDYQDMVVSPRKDKGKGKMKYLPELPEEVWQRVWAFYYGQCASEWQVVGGSHHALTPLLLSAEHTRIALPVFYAHPLVTYKAIPSFLQAITTPSPWVVNYNPPSIVIRNLTICASSPSPALYPDSTPRPAVVHSLLPQLFASLPRLLTLHLKDTLVLHSLDANTLFQALQQIKPCKARLEFRMWDLSDSPFGQDLIAATRPSIHTPMNRTPLAAGRGESRVRDRLAALDMGRHAMQEQWRDALWRGTELDLPAWWIDIPKTAAAGLAAHGFAGAWQGGVGQPATVATAIAAAMNYGAGGGGAAGPANGLPPYVVNAWGGPGAMSAYAAAGQAGHPPMPPWAHYAAHVNTQPAPPLAHPAPPTTAPNPPNVPPATLPTGPSTSVIPPTPPTIPSLADTDYTGGYSSDELSDDSGRRGHFSAVLQRIKHERERRLAQQAAMSAAGTSGSAGTGSTSGAAAQFGQSHASSTSSASRLIPEDDDDDEDAEEGIFDPPVGSSFRGFGGRLATSLDRLRNIKRSGSGGPESAQASQTSTASMASGSASIQTPNPSSSSPAPAGPSDTSTTPSVLQTPTTQPGDSPSRRRRQIIDAVWPQPSLTLSAPAALQPAPILTLQPVVQPSTYYPANRFQSPGQVSYHLAHTMRRQLLELITEHWAPTVQALSIVAFDPLATLILRSPTADTFVNVPIPHIRVHLPRGINSLAVFKGSAENARDRKRNRRGSGTPGSAASDDGSPDLNDEEGRRIVGGDGYGGGLVHDETRLFEIEVNTIREMADEMWDRAGDQLPPQVCRMLVGEAGSEWDAVSWAAGGGSGSASARGGGFMIPGEEMDVDDAVSSVAAESDDFALSDSDDMSVDGEEESEDEDGGSGTYDRAAAEAQEARMRERKAEKARAKMDEMME